MDRPCGCASAEQCWKKCCCFSNGQKVAWAKKHGLRLPKYVVVAAKREMQAKTAATSTTNKHRCAHCVASSTEHAPAKTTRPPASTRQTQASTRLFHGLIALECRGLTMLWQILSLAMLPHPIGVELSGPRIETTVSDLPCNMESRCPTAPEPPPRLGAAGFRTA